MNKNEGRNLSDSKLEGLSRRWWILKNEMICISRRHVCLFDDEQWWILITYYGSGMVVRQRKIVIAVVQLKVQNRVKVINFDQNNIQF